ncbi:MAG: VWA domain-containing protein [Planctomycetota bacterium]|nr:VWA domain-containing protein [Planctomycetota bacterium]MDA1211538.1 VWA domain-containing protein [Planctomycetota bacterium]
MYFANPWGLLGLLALPAIVVIHMYHHRFPPLVIAGSHLWEFEEQRQSPGRKRSKLPITPSLLLELLAALFISLIIADPRFDEMNRVTHWVVVLDQSASMASKFDGEKTFRDAAVEELTARLEDSGRNTVVTLIESGHRPTMLIGPAASVEETLPVLETWTPRAPMHDFGPSWDLASQFAGETGRLLFLTDHLPSTSEVIPTAMEIVSFGRQLDNLAFTTARWTYDSTESKGQLYVRIANLGRTSQTATLKGISGNRTIFNQELNLAADQELPFEASLPGGLGRLTLSITSSSNALAIDDTVTLIEPKIRSLSVNLAFGEDQSAGHTARQVLMQLDDINLTDATKAQLIIAPAEKIAPLAEEQWWLGIGPLNSSDTAISQALDLVGPYLIDKRHPLLEGVTLGGVVCGGVQKTDRSLTPLISVGKIPLLGELNTSAAKAYLLNLDMNRSNLRESPDWPILISNLVEMRRRELPGQSRWNYRLGETVQFRWPLPEVSGNTSTKVPELLLIHNGESRPLPRGEFVEIPPLEEPGIYEIHEENQSIGLFSVLFFDRRESTLKELSPGRRAPITPTEGIGYTLDDPMTWLLLLGIVIVLLMLFSDWKILKPSLGR